MELNPGEGGQTPGETDRTGRHKKETGTRDRDRRRRQRRGGNQRKKQAVGREGGTAYKPLVGQLFADSHPQARLYLRAML